MFDVDPTLHKAKDAVAKVHITNMKRIQNIVTFVEHILYPNI